MFTYYRFGSLNLFIGRSDKIYFLLYSLLFTGVLAPTSFLLPLFSLYWFVTILYTYTLIQSYTLHFTNYTFNTLHYTLHFTHYITHYICSYIYVSSPRRFCFVLCWRNCLAFLVLFSNSLVEVLVREWSCYVTAVSIVFSYNFLIWVKSQQNLS